MSARIATFARPARRLIAVSTVALLSAAGTLSAAEATPEIDLRPTSRSLLYMVVGLVFGFTAGLIAFYQYRKSQGRNLIREGEEYKKKILDEAELAKKQLESKLKEMELSRKEELNQQIAKEMSQLNEDRKQLTKTEERLAKSVEAIEKREDEIEERHEEIEKKLVRMGDLEKLAQKKREELDELYTKQNNVLAKVAHMTADEAREKLLKNVEHKLDLEVSEMTRRAEKQARQNAEDKARKILIETIQRVATSFTSENTVSTVALANDDMKGRIIGREGRNIRAFEQTTGIDVIVDDTPGVVVVSGFDPVRREIARLTMEKLVKDGRIHPARIEEMFAEATKEIEKIIESTGQDVSVDFQMPDLHPKLRTMLGRLRYRTSYGQNVLQHSAEVAKICGMLATDLKLKKNIAIRCGLLHDIGKAADADREGTHPVIGREVAQQCNEGPEVLEAIEGHHGDIEIKSQYTYLVMIADAISAARPGARRESLERYVKRMEGLEEIAMRQNGIERAFAIHAGREIRVLARAEELSDADCLNAARAIAKQIEIEMNFPGEVKVTVIRESRFIDYAR
ncbi:MAG TPA: ribonuclease Y [Planctomycetota bacterium]|nr:ribonuclease Y [Planctomycetota bacterium]